MAKIKPKQLRVIVTVPKKKLSEGILDCQKEAEKIFKDYLKKHRFSKPEWVVCIPQFSFREEKGVKCSCTASF